MTKPRVRDRKGIGLGTFGTLYFAHLEESGLSYTRHMFRALSFSGRCLLWAGQALIHALVPCLYEDLSSRMGRVIEEL